MTFSLPPQNAAEMLALQKKYGGDADIAAALGIARHAVERHRQRYRLPAVAQRSRRSAKKSKKISEEAIAEMFAGRKFR